MADRGILMSAPMVRALLDGRKTQTRRLLSLRGFREFSDFGPSDTCGYDWHLRRADGCWCDFRHDDLLSILQHRVCDRLWVREAWRYALEYDELPGSELPGNRALVEYDVDVRQNGSREAGRYRHARFMPLWASRITLTVTDVRVERVQDISHADAKAEGVERYDLPDDIPIPPGMLNPSSYKMGFWKIWNSLHDKPGERWEDNPWVVAVYFSPKLGNIDEVAA